MSEIVSKAAECEKRSSSPKPPPPPPPFGPVVVTSASSSNSATKSTTKIDEFCEPVILKAFAEFMKDPANLEVAANYLLQSLVEDAIMGVFLEIHHSVKTGSLVAIDGEPEDDSTYKIVDLPNYDVFGVSTAKKPMDCNCPNCDRLVAAARFAPHLEKCMGMGRNSSRIASRRLANAKEGSSSYFQSNGSDDDDDADWSSEKKRKKASHNSRTNGSKKNGKTS